MSGMERRQLGSSVGTPNAGASLLGASGPGRPESPRPFCNTWPFPVSDLDLVLPEDNDKAHKARGCCDGWLPVVTTPVSVLPNHVSVPGLTLAEDVARRRGVTVATAPAAVQTCGACPHLLTAHTVPDGRCLLCECTGWTDDPIAREAGAESADARHRFVVAVLSCTRFPGCPDEYTLQHAAAERLRATGAPVEREVVLSPTDRPDLLVAGVCIEVKVAGSAAQVLAQLKRYASHPQVESLVLLTRRAQHRSVPSEVEGKLLTVVFTAGVL